MSSLMGNKATILITGADGFIGSHLTEMLSAKGYRIKALSQYNSFNNWGWLEDVNCKDQIEVLTGDVRDSNYCKRMTKGVDVIFHLAALIGIPYSYVAPDSYVDTNMKGTLNICQAALENGCERVIHTSTSEVYGTAQYVPIDEKHPLHPQSPYSASKIGADAMAESFYKAFGLPLTIARPFNTYGPRQSARAVIPAIITQIASGKKKIDLGDITPTRDFSYVKDTCRGFIALAGSEKAIGETVNIGSNFEIAKIPTDGIPPFIFYLSGTIVWGYFSVCLKETGTTFVANAQVFGKVYFPRVTVPISIAITAVFQFLIQFIIFLGFFFYFKLSGSSLQPNIYILTLPLIVLHMAVLSVGTGLLISAATAKYRDLTFAMGFVVQLWMYLTPVVYPLSEVPDRFKIFILINPMTAVVESFRGAFLGASSLTLGGLLLSIILTILVFIGGIITFSRVEKTFMDTV